MQAHRLCLSLLSDCILLSVGAGRFNTPVSMSRQWSQNPDGKWSFRGEIGDEVEGILLGYRLNMDTVVTDVVPSQGGTEKETDWRLVRQRTTTSTASSSCTCHELLLSTVV